LVCTRNVGSSSPEAERDRHLLLVDLVFGSTATLITGFREDDLLELDRRVGRAEACRRRDLL